ncbi:MAG: glycosyltransferase family 2 protein [Betaproteobacteria bacterium]|nr:MAG: glycosyltransferase family 2 protein [Betaproteobacteria bacterium]
MTPTVSAVIPTYNRRRELAAAIASALCQTHRLHEIIVIDDGSTDGTWDDLQALAASERSTRVLVRRQENAGPSAARNSALRLASGEFIAFLDSDDVWHENKTARQLAVFSAQPDHAMVGCVAEEMNVFPGQRIVPIDTGRLLFRNYFLTPGVIVRREVLASVGGFAEDMSRCEDYDLWLRIAASHRCALLNEVLMSCGSGKRTFGHSGLSASLWDIQSGELQAFRRWRARGGAALKYRCALAISWLRFARRVLLVTLDALRPGR